MKRGRLLIVLIALNLVFDAGCNLIVNRNKANLTSTAAVAGASGDATPATEEKATADAASSSVATQAASADTASAKTSTASDSAFPLSLRDLPFYQDAKVFTPKANAVAYDVEAPLWSDGAHKFRYIVLPDGKQVDYDEAGQKLTFPVGTYLVKHFAAAADGSHPVETRVMRLGDDKAWSFATYQWAEDGSASLIKDAVSIAANSDWPGGYRIPSSSEDCVKCHAASPSEVIGFQPDQLKTALPNLVTKGVMSDALSKKLEDLPARVNPADATLDAKTRLLAYLDLNCGTCHRPGGPNSYLLLNSANIDLAWLARKSYLVQGDLDGSKIWQRFSATSNRMPQVSVVQDPLGTEIIKAYITNATP